ncbi:FAD-binding oxidoreductase [Thermogemmatispora sp.]|uniref:FAD-binding oxidoreductase n=1 Tax=Thermogemmatispora sp. TaxID=1968838 RepID=UPI0035E447B4
MSEPSKQNNGGRPAALQGRLFWRGQPGYEEARCGRIFNGRRPARYPAAILMATSEEDVVAGVRLAREQGLKVSVRAGGHSWAAWSLRDDALLIDLGGLRQIELDREAGIMRVSPAVTGSELNNLLTQQGLMFPGGHCPDVGLGGFLLQGGMGWNCRGWGWACQRVAAIDVVTAEGELLHADEHEHADLLWAARGAGPGFFAIVTRFYLRVRPLPAALTRSSFFYPAALFDEVMGWLYEIHPRLAPSVEVVAVGMGSGGDLTGTAAPLLLVQGLSFAESPAEAREALAPFESCPARERALLAQTMVPTTLAAEYAEQRRANPKEHRYAVDNAWLNAPAPAAIPALREAFVSLPTPQSFSLWFGMAPLHPLPDMALSLQADVYFASYVVWQQPEDDARCRRWLTEQMGRIEPLSEGLFLADSDFTTRAARFMEESHWQRLQALRARYDPTGLFHAYLINPETPINTNAWNPS